MTETYEAAGDVRDYLAAHASPIEALDALYRDLCDALGNGDNARVKRLCDAISIFDDIAKQGQAHGLARAGRGGG